MAVCANCLTLSVVLIIRVAKVENCHLCSKCFCKADSLVIFLQASSSAADY